MNALDEGVSLPLTDKFFRLTFLVDMNQGQAYLFMSNEIIFEFVFDKSMVRPRMHPYVLLCSYDQVFRLEPEPKSVGFASTLNVNQERARANTLDSRVDDTHSNITRDQPTEKDDGFGIKLRSSICLPSHVPTVTRHAPKGMEWKKPLWEELGAPTESLFFDDDNTRLLSSGSLNRIIEYLSSKPLDGYVMADENVFTFTFSVVARQELVMERLIDRYSLSEDHGLSPQDLADIRSKTIHLISMTISRSNLLDDPAVRNMVESFAGALEIKQHTSSSKIIRYLLCDYASRKKSSNPIISLISVQAGDEKITTPSQFMKRDVFKVAECVTEIDYQSFQALTATDILDQYKISRKNRQSTKVLHRITERYSQFKNWIRLIIKETSGPRLVETVSFFTSLSISFMILHNYHSLFATLNGVKEGLGERYNHIFSVMRFDMERIGQLQACLSSQGNFRFYREKYDNAPSPKIPYIDTHLAAIKSAVEELIIRKDGSSLIDFTQLRVISKETACIMEGTQCATKRKTAPEIVQYLKSNVFI
eukprot:TRINITY_DN6842_c0_g1_i3.p1 TRINITY_DN6842_c0_g1~~TRINITY_DN6842_c0_g1_i3.p1  ORF type:complete len:535 (+),score=81.75 TRINITY_DN6842_c0_g1_i3:184-1788(+)